MKSDVANKLQKNVLNQLLEKQPHSNTSLAFINNEVSDLQQ